MSSEEQKRNGTYMTDAERRRRELEQLKLQQMIDGMISRGEEVPQHLLDRLHGEHTGDDQKSNKFRIQRVKKNKTAAHPASTAVCCLE